MRLLPLRVLLACVVSFCWAPGAVESVDNFYNKSWEALKKLINEVNPTLDLSKFDNSKNSANLFALALANFGLNNGTNKDSIQALFGIAGAVFVAIANEKTVEKVIRTGIQQPQFNTIINIGIKGLALTVVQHDTEFKFAFAIWSGDKFLDEIDDALGKKLRLLPEAMFEAALPKEPTKAQVISCPKERGEDSYKTFMKYLKNGGKQVLINALSNGACGLQLLWKPDKVDCSVKLVWIKKELTQPDESFPLPRFETRLIGHVAKKDTPSQTDKQKPSFLSDPFRLFRKKKNNNKSKGDKNNEADGVSGSNMAVKSPEKMQNPAQEIEQTVSTNKLTASQVSESGEEGDTSEGPKTTPQNPPNTKPIIPENSVTADTVTTPKTHELTIGENDELACELRKKNWKIGSNSLAILSENVVKENGAASLAAKSIVESTINFPSNHNIKHAETQVITIYGHGSYLKQTIGLFLQHEFNPSENEQYTVGEIREVGVCGAATPLETVGCSKSFSSHTYYVCIVIIKQNCTQLVDGPNFKIYSDEIIKLMSEAVDKKNFPTQKDVKENPSNGKYDDFTNYGKEGRTVMINKEWTIGPFENKVKFTKEIKEAGYAMDLAKAVVAEKLFSRNQRQDLFGHIIVTCVGQSEEPNSIWADFVMNNFDPTELGIFAEDEIVEVGVWGSTVPIGEKEKPVTKYNACIVVLRRNNTFLKMLVARYPMFEFSVKVTIKGLKIKRDNIENEIEDLKDLIITDSNVYFDFITNNFINEDALEKQDEFAFDQLMRKDGCAKHQKPTYVKTPGGIVEYKTPNSAESNWAKFFVVWAYNKKIFIVTIFDPEQTDRFVLTEAFQMESCRNTNNANDVEYGAVGRNKLSKMSWVGIDGTLHLTSEFKEEGYAADLAIAVVENRKMFPGNEQEELSGITIITRSGRNVESHTTWADFLENNFLPAELCFKKDEIIEVAVWGATDYDKSEETSCPIPEYYACIAVVKRNNPFINMLVHQHPEIEFSVPSTIEALKVKKDNKGNKIADIGDLVISTSDLYFDYYSKVIKNEQLQHIEEVAFKLILSNGGYFNKDTPAYVNGSDGVVRSNTSKLQYSTTFIVFWVHNTVMHVVVIFDSVLADASERHLVKSTFEENGNLKKRSLAEKQYNSGFEMEGREIMLQKIWKIGSIEMKLTNATIKESGYAADLATEFAADNFKLATEISRENLPGLILITITGKTSGTETDWSNFFNKNFHPTELQNFKENEIIEVGVCGATETTESDTTSEPETQFFASVIILTRGNPLVNMLLSSAPEYWMGVRATVVAFKIMEGNRQSQIANEKKLNIPQSLVYFTFFQHPFPVADNKLSQDELATKFLTTEISSKYLQTPKYVKNDRTISNYEAYDNCIWSKSTLAWTHGLDLNILIVFDVMNENYLLKDVYQEPYSENNHNDDKKSEEKLIDVENYGAKKVGSDPKATGGTEPVKSCIRGSVLPVSTKLRCTIKWHLNDSIRIPSAPRPASPKRQWRRTNPEQVNISSVEKAALEAIRSVRSDNGCIYKGIELGKKAQDLLKSAKTQDNTTQNNNTAPNHKVTNVWNSTKISEDGQKYCILSINLAQPSFNGNFLPDAVKQKLKSQILKAKTKNDSKIEILLEDRLLEGAISVVISIDNKAAEVNIAILLPPEPVPFAQTK